MPRIGAGITTPLVNRFSVEMLFAESVEATTRSSGDEPLVRLFMERRAGVAKPDPAWEATADTDRNRGIPRRAPIRDVETRMKPRSAGGPI
ncbi:MAG TPA: hypothetical protein VKF80_10850 [Candidatus Eisenbacteria bacterium]|nr:hypothetical protein [Candidatus Eisenbacteria bacterium]